MFYDLDLPKVKSIQASRPDDLDSQINNWILSHKNVSVKNITFSFHILKVQYK